VSERVTHARELVAAGHRPAVVARVLQISRQAIYRVPRPRRAPAAPKRPPVDEVEAAIVDVATEHPTDGYHECLVRLGKPEPARIVKQQLDVALARADIPIKSSCFCRMTHHAAVA
jgi:hypothetical protein